MLAQLFLNACVTGARMAAQRKALAWLAIGLALSNVLGPVVAGVMIGAAGALIGVSGMFWVAG
ncbi:hypothetical protein [Variovorax sp. WS11]|uniref:hypothetical protein n=1 Tax=Variovorax sp. WS11 TaxID=1105204 RepID=UPI0011B20B65|nr:hypothetical protein [Variovorax sp. WS11]NDZ13623.1 hypothetical protein [Variovorax sp. WS11]